MKRDVGLLAAIEALGSVSGLARGLSISVAAVAMWRRVPAARVPEVSRISGVPRYVLRPDLYERPVPPEAPRRMRAGAA